MENIEQTARDILENYLNGNLSDAKEKIRALGPMVAAAVAVFACRQYEEADSPDKYLLLAFGNWILRLASEEGAR